MALSQFGRLLSEVYETPERIRRFVMGVERDLAGELSMNNANDCAANAIEAIEDAGLVDKACEVLAREFPNRSSEILAFRTTAILTAKYGDVSHTKLHPSGCVVIGRAFRLEHVKPVGPGAGRMYGRWQRVCDIQGDRELSFVTINFADNVSRAHAVLRRDGDNISVTGLPDTIGTWAGRSLDTLSRLGDAPLQIGRAGVVVLAAVPELPEAVRLCVFAGAEAYHAESDLFAALPASPPSTMGPSPDMSQNIRAVPATPYVPMHRARAPGQAQPLQRAAISYSHRHLGAPTRTPSVENVEEPAADVMVSTAPLLDDGHEF